MPSPLLEIFDFAPAAADLKIMRGTNDERKMEEMIYCQSCGMPMTGVEHFGTNADDSQNRDYCVFCYAGGGFTEECTMDEMIDHCADMVEEFNRGAPEPITREQAVERMKEYFPKLKRWANN